MNNGKNGDSIFVLGLDYNPTQNATFISTSIGVLNEQEGLGMLFFGKPILSKDMFDAIEANKAQRVNPEKGAATK